MNLKGLDLPFTKDEIFWAMRNLGKTQPLELMTLLWNLFYIYNDFVNISRIPTPMKLIS